MIKIHCPNAQCGNIIDDEWKYCNECGLNIQSFLNDERRMLEWAKESDKNGNYKDAVYMLKRCSKFGNADAMYLLGLHCESGKGTPQNFQWVKYCMEKAAKRRQTDAVLWLAEAYEVGKCSIETDLKEALNWYRIAYDLGIESIKDKIDFLTEHIGYSETSADVFGDDYDDESEETAAESFDLSDIEKDHSVRAISGAIVKKSFSKPLKLGSREQIEQEEKKILAEIIYRIECGLKKLRGERIPVRTVDWADEDELIEFQNDMACNVDTEKEIGLLSDVIDSPYFARLCLLNDKNEKKDFYVGRQAVSVDGKILVYSWASPLGQKVYDKVNTNFRIEVTDKYKKTYITNYALQLKRKFDIKERKLLSVVQEYPLPDGSDSGLVFDEFLLHILRQKKYDKKLSDIIPSIQSNQNEIIKRPANENLIVQGCAGSGKTMILLHRLVYLRTNEGIDFSKIRILTPGENFNAHIDSLWRELKLDSVVKSTIVQYYFDKLLSYDARWQRLLQDRIVRRKEDGNVAERKLLGKVLSDDSDLPDSIVEYYYSEQFCADVENAWYELVEEYRNKCEKITENYNRVKIPQWKKRKREYDLMPVSYRPETPPSKPKLLLPMISIFSDIFAKLKPAYKSNGKLHKCELYASLLLSYKLLGARHEERILCVDEGQDLSVPEYLLIKSINDNKVVFNIYGDTNQLLNPKTGIAEWQNLRTVGNFSYYELNENYRNTREITCFTNETLGREMTALGIDGNKVLFIREEDIFFRLKNENNADRIALIYAAANPLKNQRILSLAAEKKNVALLTVKESKGMEFDNVYVVPRGMSEHEKYIAYTRALSVLYVAE